MPSVKKPNPDAGPAEWILYAAYLARQRALYRKYYQRNPNSFLDRCRAYRTKKQRKVPQGSPRTPCSKTR